MKRITMILIATLTLALLVYAQSRTTVRTSEKAQAARLASDNLITQATQKGTDAPLIATPQDAQKAIQGGILGRIASTANNSLRNYPSLRQIRNIEDPKIRSILERGRNLLEAGKAATRWNATRLSDFASQVDQYTKEAEAVKNSGGSTPQEDCGAAKDRCVTRCNEKIDPGYWCYFDCRLEYMACLGSTLGGKHPSIS
jgi:hypothetical protein